MIYDVAMEDDSPKTQCIRCELLEAEVVSLETMVESLSKSVKDLTKSLKQ
jgi:hypothetical protein